MSQRVVIRAPVADGVRPGERVVTGRVDRGGLESQEYLDARTRVVSKCVELFRQGKATFETGCRRMGAVFDDHCSGARPWMVFEVGTDDRPVLRPVVKSVGG